MHPDIKLKFFEHRMPLRTASIRYIDLVHVPRKLVLFCTTFTPTLRRTKPKTEFFSHGPIWKKSDTVRVSG